MGVMNEPAAPARRIEGHGTLAADWRSWGGIDLLPSVPVDGLVPPQRRAVIVAPHPDDEVLACGGLLQQLHAQGSRSVLLAVTDGAASHPGSSHHTPAALARLRPRETEAALAALGLSGAAAPQVVRAHIDDGRVNANMETLHNLMLQLLRPDDVVFVTWRQDGHPDHEACGMAAALAARACRATLIEMPIWGWHWSEPGDGRMPWSRACRLELSAADLQRKRRAIACFQSQLQADPSTGSPPVLGPHTLDRLLQPYEIFFT